MGDLPERFYVSFGDPLAWDFWRIGAEPSEGAVEYIRADLAPPPTPVEEEEK